MDESYKHKVEEKKTDKKEYIFLFIKISKSGKVNL